MRILKIEIPNGITLANLRGYIVNTYGFNASDNEILIVRALLAL